MEEFSTGVTFSMNDLIMFCEKFENGDVLLDFEMDSLIAG